MQKPKSLFLVFFLLVSKLYCQKLIWTGTDNSNFFNESNWIVEGSNTAPIPNTINPLIAVNRELVIDNAININANGTINLGSGSISITSSNLEALAIQSGTLTINEGGYINIANDDGLQNNVSIEINHPLAWIKLDKTNPQAVLDNYLNQITVNGNNAIYSQNLRLTIITQKAASLELIMKILRRYMFLKAQTFLAIMHISILVSLPLKTKYLII